MTAPDIHALTGPYVLDALPADERAAFEEHLADCPSCTAEVDELRETTAKLGATTERPAPPQLRAKVLAGIANIRQLSPIVPTTATDPAQPTAERRAGAERVGDEVAGESRADAERVGELASRRGPGRRAVLGLAAAAVVVAGVGGVAVERGREVSRLDRENRELAEVLRAPDSRVLRTQVEGGGDATVVASVSRDVAVVILAGLPTAPDGRAYQLWFIERERARSLAVTTSGGTTVVRGGLNRASAFGLTLEPRSGSDQPTTSPIALVGMT